jgi:putative ABC transport system permease protein
MNKLWLDLRYAIRVLLKNPGFAMVAMGTLALGVGANTAIFSFVNGVLFRPLPFPHPDRLVVLKEKNPEKSQRLSTVSPRDLEDWERQSETIEEFGAWRDWRFKLDTPEGPELVASAIATPGLFATLGVKAVHGRTFLPEEDQRGRDHVVLITDSYWRTRFGADPGVVGQKIILDNQSFEIVGVLPPEFEALDLGFYQVWAPVSVDEDQFLARHVRNRRVYGRLKENITLGQAQAEMQVISEQLGDRYPETNGGWTVVVNSLKDEETSDLAPTLLIFFAAVGLVLLIACANIASLMLTRAITRRREFAIRSALGAARWRVVRQLLTESLVLSVVGGGAGLALAPFLVNLLIKTSPDMTPRAEQVGIDGWVLAFSAGLAIITGILFGLVPALQSSRINLVEALKEGGQSSQAGHGVRLRGSLVAGQLAIALVLLTGAGLLSQSFVRMITIRPGFNPENLYTVQLFIPLDKYKSGNDVAAVYQRATAEFEAIPGVESVGATSAGPQFGGYEPVDFLLEGGSPKPSGEYPQARYYNVGPAYFRTLQIPVLEGREVLESDAGGSTAVAIINQTMARRYFPNQDPIGRTVLLPRSKDSVEIVGVVGDVRRFGMGGQTEAEIYWPYMQRPRWASYFVFRTKGDPAALLSSVRSRVNNIDPSIVVTNAASMDRLVSRALKRPRFNAVLIGAFAATAIMLAAIGLYGVISYGVEHRRHEIGIRIALGADRKSVLLLVLKQGAILAGAGLAMGLAASIVLTRFLSSMLYEVAATDVATFSAVAALLFVVAIVASYLPALRATRVDPMAALRCE